MSGTDQYHWGTDAHTERCRENRQRKTRDVPFTRATLEPLAALRDVAATVYDGRGDDRMVPVPALEAPGNVLIATETEERVTDVYQLVRSEEGDWECLIMGDTIIKEGHSLRAFHVLDALGIAYLESTVADVDWDDFHGQLKRGPDSRV